MGNVGNICLCGISYCEIVEKEYILFSFITFNPLRHSPAHKTLYFLDQWFSNCGTCTWHHWCYAKHPNVVRQIKPKC